MEILVDAILFYDEKESFYAKAIILALGPDTKISILQIQLPHVLRWKIPSRSESPSFWNVKNVSIDSIVSNLLLASDSYPFGELEIMCLETEPSVDLLKLWLSWLILSLKFFCRLEQNFARVLITLVLCILSVSEISWSLINFSQALTKCFKRSASRTFGMSTLENKFFTNGSAFCNFSSQISSG